MTDPPFDLDTLAIRFAERRAKIAAIELEVKLKRAYTKFDRWFRDIFVPDTSDEKISEVRQKCREFEREWNALVKKFDDSGDSAQLSDGLRRLRAVLTEIQSNHQR